MSDVNEFNLEIGQQVVRPYTEEEVSEINAFKAIVPEKVIIENEIDPIKQSALAKLEQLGLTNDEVLSVIGGL